MPVSAVGAGDVVVRLQRLANAHRYRFLALVKVRQARHQSAEVKVVGALLEFPDAHHLPVHPQQPIDSDVGSAFRMSGNRRLSRVGHLLAPNLPQRIGLATKSCPVLSYSIQLLPAQSTPAQSDLFA